MNKLLTITEPDNIKKLPSVYFPSDKASRTAHIGSMKQYDELYRESLLEPETFWLKYALKYYWATPPPKNSILRYNFDIRKGKISVEWFAGGKTNMCFNALDRHMQNNSQKIAFYWEGNYPGDRKSITYESLLHKVWFINSAQYLTSLFSPVKISDLRAVCHFGQSLRYLGISKGDRVAIYMPMVLEAIIAMLACARIGAVHSVIFGGYSADSLAQRIIDAE
ncbi:unnamed protein product [Protopolystoma xenopodis]|uniref:acetate--CoA ligase n=1 Tax=Protopolystoma xenopodis TaxID=117903 RepID=A0A448W9Q6_9PLAT|nr:unnamed protein product [Protopolystoma xenopodis]